MKTKILFVQFANSMFLRHEECDGYWDAFYNRYSDLGYWRGKYVFEPPKWIAECDYFLDEDLFERELLWCEHSISEIIKKIETYKPDYTLFSLMDCNKHFIRDVIEHLPQYQYIIGGYNEEFLETLSNDFENVHYVHNMKEDADVLGVKYKMGTKYSLMKGETVLPRLTLSYGCLNKCKFCIIPHGKIIDVDEDIIIQQVKSFKDLKFKLIYIDDKTFGQSKTIFLLPKLTEIIKDYNPQFEGYVVQTTSGMLRTHLRDFKKLGVKVAEIGMETHNNPILRAYNKPSTERLVEDCIELCKENGIELILNVVIGFPEETEETYERTYHLIEENLADRVFGINPAIYTDYDNEDNQGEIDFQESEKIELHRKWWKKINKLGIEKLNKNNEN